MGNDSLKTKAYTIIRNKIADCEYTPGVMITEGQLKDELNISRTPIRDALGRLEQERLITIKPKKGIQVSPITINDISEVFEIRSLFEPYALNNYGYRLKESDLIKEYKLFEERGQGKEDGSSFAEDDSFHNMIINAVPNQYLHQYYDIIRIQNNRLRILSGRADGQRLIDSSNEHIKIIKFCLQKDWTAASIAMQEHLEKAKESSFNFILENKYNCFTAKA
jgi:DNA-binding GntR family transcriptional regulator